MPFIVPVVAAALEIGAIGQALLAAGVSAGLSYAASRIGPSQRDLAAARGQRGAHLSLRLDPKAPREIILGESATAGTLVYHHTYNSGQALELVIALSDYPCDSLSGLWVNGEPVTYDAGTGFTTEYGANLFIRFYSGDGSQAADADLIDHSGGRWTSAERGRGVAYVYVRMYYVASLWHGRQPTLLFRVKGARLYDWRKDSTNGGTGAHRWGFPSTYEWTDNPAVIWYNWRRGLWVNGQRIAGMATPSRALSVASATAAANMCDEAVALKAGGTEKRYRAGGVVSARTRNREVIQDLAAAVAGAEIDSGGEIRLAPGVAQSPVMSFTDDDIMSEEEVKTWRKRTRRDLVNSVYGSFRDPAQRFDEIALPPRRSSTDITADAGPLEQTYDLDLVTSGTQGQRVLEILRRRHRYQGGVRLTLRPRYGVLEAGDWVTWTSAAYGYTDQLFEVVTSAIRTDLSVDLVLRETSTSIYSWDAASDEIDVAAPPDLPAGSLGEASIAGLAVGAVTVTSGNGAHQRPGIAATWTAPVDPTIVSVDLEYRRSGDAVALTKRAEDASAGSLTWLDGVQGETVYQVRARPVCRPERAVAWSGWVSTAAATALHITSSLPQAPAEGSVGGIHLDAQTRFELSLATAVDEVHGSLRELVDDAMDRIHEAGEAALAGLVRIRAEEGNRKAAILYEETARATQDAALAAAIEVLQASVASTSAEITTERVVRAADDGAIAAQQTTLSTTVAGHTTTLTEHASSIDGMSARWGVSIETGGSITGRVRLDGTGATSSFDVVADLFRVAQPGAPGGAAIPVFTVGNVLGVPKVALRGDMLVDGTIAARHLSVTSLDAITANMGTLTAGKMQSADGKFVIDLTAKTITIET